MRLRVLSLPIAFLIVVGLLVAAVISIGAVPTNVAVALVSGVVAALLTGGFTLVGIWMTLRQQLERDRFDRLRVAYADLMRAAEYVRSAVVELTDNPKGRPSPYVPLAGTGIFTTTQPGTLGPAQYPPKEVAEYNPYYVADEALDRAGDLLAQAEASIYLEEGSNSRVLERWNAVEAAYNEFRLALAEEDGNLIQARRADLTRALAALRDTAHQELKRLRVG